jgi:hypothetical protein
MKLQTAIAVTLVSLVWVAPHVAAQQTDSSNNVSVLAVADSNKVEVAYTGHSVRRAVRYSAMLPGLGQAYNRKYWKIPIIYGLGGFTTYSAIQSSRLYIRHRNAYRLRVDNDPSTIDEFAGQMNNAVLRQNRDFYRQQRDLFWILTAGVYALNLIDASVDAHLFDFNVSDNLSMHLFQPPAVQWADAPGMQLPLARLSFKL